MWCDFLDHNRLWCEEKANISGSPNRNAASTLALMELSSVPHRGKSARAVFSGGGFDALA